MANPITGPQSTLLRNTPTEIGGMYDSRYGFKQARPYNIPLPYRRKRRAVLQGGGKAPNITPLYNWWTQTGLDDVNTRYREVPDISLESWSELSAEVDRRLNKARSKFFAEANSRVSLSIDLLQGRQALDMMTKRLSQAGRVMRFIAKRQPKKAVEALLGHRVQSVLSPREWRSRIRDASGLWLEYSYGWKPLVKDIFEASQVLSLPVKDIYIHARSSSPFETVYTQTKESWWDSKTVETNSVKLKVFARVGGVVSVTNPNLQIAKNAGLTNPLAWAWELVPWSFVVDWFVNVGKIIESLDDTLGLTVSDGYYTVGFKGSSRIDYRLVKYIPPGMGGYAHEWDGSYAWKSRSVIWVDRSRGVPPVRLVRSVRILTNLDRALNAASLLGSRLR